MTPEKSTKERIFDAAVSLFATRGFRGTTMRDLSGAVGIKESSLYNHYKGKDALLDAVLEYQLNGINRAMLSRREMEKYSSGQTDPVKLWLEGVDLFTQRLPPLTEMINRIIHNEMYLDERFRRFYLDHLLKTQKAMTEVLLEDLMRKRMIRECPIVPTAARYVSMMHGLAQENTLLLLDGAREDQIRLNTAEQISLFIGELK